MSNNNFNSIQPVKSRLRRSLDKFKRRFRSPRRKNTRKNTKPKHKLTPKQVNNAMRGNYGSLNRNTIEYLNSLYPTNKNVPVISKNTRKKLGVSEYKSRAQQILNKNLGQKKRTKLNRVKRFVKSLSPKRFINRFRKRNKIKPSQNNTPVPTPGRVPNSTPTPNPIQVNNRQSYNNNVYYALPQSNGTVKNMSKSQIPPALFNVYGTYLKKMRIN